MDKLTAGGNSDESVKYHFYRSTHSVARCVDTNHAENYSLRMNTVAFRRGCAILLLCAVTLVSCARQGKILTMEEETLFSLPYGNFEDQLNLFSQDKAGAFKTALTMHDGFFYIMNGESEKILALNSYGDILSLYYNEDLYSTGPRVLSPQPPSANPKKIAYPFTMDGKITVDGRKYVYAACSIPKERSEQDENGTLLYSQVVLRISSDGSAVDYIGQQGPGGTPFSYITGLYATENNELVAICKTNDGLNVFWFAENGFLRNKIPLSIHDMPVLEKDDERFSEEDVSVTIENAVPDSAAGTLYVKADYYIPHIDEESKVRSGIDYLESRVYPLDIDTGIFGQSIGIPPYEEVVTEDFTRITYRLPYDFLGITKGGWLYFIVTTESGFSIEMIHSGTHSIIRRKLDVSHKDQLYYSFALSNEGIISALLADKNSARIVWWRTDSLIAALIK